MVHDEGTIRGGATPVSVGQSSLTLPASASSARAKGRSTVNTRQSGREGPLSANFAWEQQQEAGATVLYFRGELDLAAAPQAIEILGAAIREGDVVLDASELSFLDSSGISAIVQAYRAANQGIGQGRSVTVRNPNPRVQRVLEITALDSLIEKDRTPDAD
jgi:anti-sigma B factor antagonist